MTTHQERLLRLVKQSSGDLQSRLKTRKLLGVGESEDGSVPLSKIHQILGGDDHCMLVVPIGLRIWQLSVAGMFATVSLLTLMFPGFMFDLPVECDNRYAYVLPARLYGAALLGFAIMTWSVVHSVTKQVIRMSLMADIIYFTIQILVTSYTIWQGDGFTLWSKLVMFVRIVSLVITLFYYICLTGVRGLRRVRSASDLDKKLE
ncbi:tumor protein p53-inducible protein 11-like isoform X1 [Saccoglossus kowalevskii]